MAGWPTGDTSVTDYEGIHEDDVATVIELRSMLVVSRTDPGMHDLLSKAKEYFVLKGSPSLKEAIDEQKVYEARFKETDEQRRYRIMNSKYGL